MSGPAAGRMLINAREKEETRIAILRDGRLDDYHIERSSRETLVDNIYKGRVENVHPSLQAAFVDIGLPKNAFLHVSEVFVPGENRHRPPGPGPRTPRLIQDLLVPGQEVVVQVIRDEFGEKGPSVTMEISLPGRYLVLTPLSTHVGISKKITNGRQRADLRALIQEMTKDRGDEVGFIVRTSGSDMTPEDLKTDLDYLSRVWRAVDQRAKQAKPPATLYQETDIVLRTIRDYYTRDLEEVVVDDKAVHDRLAGFFESVMPRERDRLRLEEGATPLFQNYAIEAQIEQLSQKQVTLATGGTIVIEQTEALTAIDVNSGRRVHDVGPEELALKTNLEAVPEIMRQLRLRDIGGIIVIDFIDMRMSRSRRDIERTIHEEARRDRSQMVVLPMSDFCLVQIARQKIRPSVVALSSDPCPACGGTGFVRNLESIGLDVLRALKGTLERADIAVIEARVSPDVATFLHTKAAELDAMRATYKKRIHISAVRGIPVSRIEFNCYDEKGEKVVELVR